MRSLVALFFGVCAALFCNNVAANEIYANRHMLILRSENWSQLDEVLNDTQKMNLESLMSDYRHRPMTLAQIHDENAQFYISLLINENDEVVSMLRLVPFEYARVIDKFIMNTVLPECILVNLVTTKDKYRGQGNATYLLQRTIDWIDENGIGKNLILYTDEWNVPANKLYINLGFEKVGELINQGFNNKTHLIKYHRTL